MCKGGSKNPCLLESLEFERPFETGALRGEVPAAGGGEEGGEGGGEGWDVGVCGEEGLCGGRWRERRRGYHWAACVRDGTPDRIGSRG